MRFGISSVIYESKFIDLVKKTKELDKLYLKYVDTIVNFALKHKFRNQPSIDAHQKLGAVRVDYGNPHRFHKSFLGDKGLFYYGIYLINLTEYFKSFSGS
jgi:hypothetical protein